VWSPAPRKEGSLPCATALLDPSWLAGYDWDTPVSDVHNDRDILNPPIDEKAFCIDKSKSG
jgi:hypothetical protein